MDKQKQIEEMAKVIHNSNEHRYADWIDYTNADLSTALKLYNAGYRKIPENAVVLTNEKLELGEYKDEVQVMNMTRQTYDAILAQARKETAEKFAERAKGFINKHKSPVGGNDFVVNVEQLISGIDQICKELSEG